MQRGQILIGQSFLNPFEIIGGQKKLFWGGGEEFVFMRKNQGRFWLVGCL